MGTIALSILVSVVFPTFANIGNISFFSYLNEGIMRRLGISVCTLIRPSAYFVSETTDRTPMKLGVCKRIEHIYTWFCWSNINPALLEIEITGFVRNSLSCTNIKYRLHEDLHRSFLMLRIKYNLNKCAMNNFWIWLRSGRTTANGPQTTVEEINPAGEDVHILWGIKTHIYFSAKLIYRTQ
jgi:hypothetical protein